MSLIVTPVLYLVVVTGAHLIQLATPLPAAFWQAVETAGRLVPDALEPLARSMDSGSLAGADWLALGRLGAALVVPGMLVMLLLWVWVRALFWHAGSGGVLLSIGARHPVREDPEERQLVNLVEEMAIAAGLPLPEVRMLDQPEPNVAAVGRGPGKATIVVTRGLLDRLDRDETQGILAHAMAQIANGDLRIAMLLLSVDQTFGLLSVVLHAGSARKARRVLWESVRGLLVRDDQSAARVADLLASDAGLDEGVRTDGCLGAVRMPFALAAATTQFLVMIGQMVLFGPFLGAMWRARRFLADASAVQLTRNPHGLAHALQRLSTTEVTFARGEASGLFFAHWRSGTQSHGPAAPIGGWYPGLAKRLARLERIGATLKRQPGAGARTAARRRWSLGGFLMGLLMALLYVVMAAGFVVMLAGAVLTTAVTLLFVGGALFGIHAAFEALPGIIHWLRVDAPDLVQRIVAALRAISGNAR